jgi:Zn-finger protein
MNIEHRTYNTELRMERSAARFDVQRSMLGVRCFHLSPYCAMSFACLLKNLLSIFLLFAFNAVALGSDFTSATQPTFLGSQGCSSSSCHGGAGEKSNQYTVWSSRDFHHERPFATLTTARSSRIADVLKIGDPTQSARCTVCHAPLQTVPPERLGKEVKITEGVSCENCHGPAENWIRSHTRKDYTHADRVAAGMRDLKNLYVRANTCVACHQNIDEDIRAAGHPELIFELDGQCATMPRHWREATNWFGAQTWLVGQAVAFREMTWQLATEKQTPSDLTNRWAGLLWVLQWGETTERDLLGFAAENFKQVQGLQDQIARQTAATVWDQSITRSALRKLASTSEAFTDKSVSNAIQARRAERLVLALDRLVAGLNELSSNSEVNRTLNHLFADSQSLPDFDPNRFAKDLNEFNATVSGILNSK